MDKKTTSFNGDDYILLAETNEAWDLKILSGFILKNYEHATWKIDSKKKWNLMEITVDERMITRVTLNGFNKFLYKYDKPVFDFGFNSRQIYEILKPVKKKDMLHFSIPNNVNELNKFTINTQITSKQQARHIDKTIIIGTYEISDIVVPDDTDYEININIDKSEFRDLTNSIKSFGGEIHIKAQENGIEFYASKSDTLEYNSIRLGDWDKSLPTLYESVISTDLIKNLHKCCSFTTKRFNFYLKQGLPLRLSIKLCEGSVVDVYLQELN